MYEFTAKEVEVFLLIIQAKSNKEIARLQTNSDRTTEVHVYNILGKTGCKNKLELIALYFNERESFPLASPKTKRYQIAELLKQKLCPSAIAKKVQTSVSYVHFVKKGIKQPVT